MQFLPYWRLSAWYFFYFAFIGAFAPYFTLYLQSLKLTAWDIGVLMSLMQVMRMLAPNLWGALANRLGRRTSIVRLAAALSAAGSLVFSLAHDFWGLFIGMSILAFFWSASLPLVEALTLDHLTGQSDRYGRIRLWGSVGFIAAVLGTGAWLDAAPLGTLPFVILLMLLGVAACAWTLPEAAPRPSPESAPMRTILRRPEVVTLLAACFFMAAAHGPFYVFYSIHLAGHGYGKMAIGAFWSLGVVAEIAVFMLMPRMMRAWSLSTILTASFILAVIRFLLIGWFADSTSLLLLAQLMHGATFGAYHAAAVAALNRWFPAPRHQAHAQALYGGISFGAGGMLGNLVSGEAWESLGPALTYSLGSVFAAIGLLLVWRGLSSANTTAR